MRTKRGRAIAWAAGILAAAVLAGITWSLRDIAIEAWSIPDLHSNDKELAKRAAERIGQHGSERSIPHLLEVMAAAGDDPQEEGSDFYEPLRLCIERAGRRALTGLESFLQGHEEPDARSMWAALKAVAIDPASGPARRLLFRAISSGDRSDRENAFDAFEAIGADTVPVLIDELNGDGDRSWAASMLEEIGPQGVSAVPLLLTALDDGDPALRIASARALVEIGAGPKEKVLSSLIEGVKGGLLGGLDAAFFLRKLGVPDAEAGAVILEGWKRLPRDHRQDRRSDCISLENLGCSHPNPGLICRRCGEDMLPILEVALQEDDAGFSALAAVRLAAIGRGEKALNKLPSFLEKLGDGDRETVEAIAAILPPRQAARVLGDAYDSEGTSDHFQRSILDVLCVRPEMVRECLPFLARVLREGPQNGKVAAAFALSFAGSRDEAVSGILTLALSDDRPEVRAAAAAGLIHRDPARKSSLLPVILEAAQSCRRLFGFWFPDRSLEALGEEARDAAVVDCWLRRDAYLTFLTLKKIGVGDEDFPIIEHALRDPDGKVRIRAAILLGLATKRGEEVLPLLIDALSDRDYWVRGNAADSLGRFGPAARAALPSLEKLLRDRRRSVRDAARGALETIRDG